MERLEEAEFLILSAPDKFTDRAQKDAYKAQQQKALSIYSAVTLNFDYPSDVLLEGLRSLYAYFPDEAVDILSRWRDGIPHLSYEKKDKMVSVLVMVTADSDIPSFQRLTTAVSLYNQGYILECYVCFADLACDPTVLIEHRIEACRFLFGSENDSYRDLAQQCILELIEDVSVYPSEWRYSIITGYTSKKGISTYFNTSRIRVPYEENFVLGLQTIFFSNESNGPRERILSGQHLLQMNGVSTEDKDEIGDKILDMARNDKYEENLRADAADVILRLGSTQQKELARSIITDLGFSTVSKRKTIYDNSQNVHDEKISEGVLSFLNNLVKISQDAIKQTFEQVHTQVVVFLKHYEYDSVKLSGTQKFKILQALNRINIDTATFTSENLTLSDIFVLVWTNISSMNETKREMHEKRLIEELLEMDGTCSSGYSSRMVNVLTSETANITISWKSQIEANVKGRVEAAIRKLPTEHGERVQLGMIENSDFKDRKIYLKFIKETLVNLEAELYREFVQGDNHEKVIYLTKDEFTEYFNDAQREWI